MKALIELSNDTQGDIRDWATFGIGTQTDLDNKQIRAALSARLNDRHRDARWVAAAERKR